MKTRQEAAELISRQFDGANGYGAPLETELSGRPKGYCWHYGKQELRELLDFIYGGEPKTEEEKIK